MTEMPEWGPRAVPSVRMWRCVELLGSLPGKNFELPILTLLLLGCSNIPSPGHLSLCWLFFKAVGFIPASEGPSTPPCAPLPAQVSALGVPRSAGASPGLLEVWSQELSWDVLVRADACAACGEGPQAWDEPELQGSWKNAV